MATYAIGDLQGCLDPLRQLLGEAGFRESADRLWLVGDLVNRGPQSLEVLRYVKSLGARATCVLGNHDLHLLMVAEGRAKAHREDTLGAILAAPERGELLDWLRGRPLMHAEGEYAMVHAGLLPSWSIAQALELAGEVGDALRGPDWRGLMAGMYGNQPDRWDDGLEGYDRLRVVINAMTRLRICTPDGRMEFTHKGRLDDIPAGYQPWFTVPGRRSAGTPVVCGHWSALGLRVEPDLLALDSGCLWGRQLSAVRLEDRRLFQVSCPKLAD
ncbi:MAG TPA: symmetrical bis(5'-nucleosyl)-tetraphosphatase [Burkholderiales bacterium]|nr:symmetrical bis(5'-nucleosyl)-tetraphosphatase [Burkholderiales bacterium]